MHPHSPAIVTLYGACLLMTLVNLVLVWIRVPSGERSPYLRLIGLNVALAVLLFSVLPGKNLVRGYWPFLVGLLAALVSAGVLTTLLLTRVWRVSEGARRLVARMALLVGSVVVTLLVAEVATQVFLVRNDGIGVTLAARLWQKQHYRLNTLSYRDEEHVLPTDPETRKVFVVGDSFAEGNGIARTQDRFTGVLQRELGDGYRVYTVAKSGWDTGDQLKALRRHPIEPDAVVLSYYVNDIDGVAARHRIQRPTFEHRETVFEPLIGSSYLANHVYWTWLRRQQRDVGKEYWEFLRGCFGREELWRAHQVELYSFVALCRSRGAPLLVVVFPDLMRVSESRSVTKQVADHFRALDVPVIDLGERLDGRPWQELVVNPRNSHAGLALSEEVGGLLARQLLVGEGRGEPSAAEAQPTDPAK